MHRQFTKLIIWVGFFCLLLATQALAGTTQYTYDSLNRLVQVQYDNGATIVYTYDAAGNRTVKQVTAFGQQPQAPANGQDLGSITDLPVLQNTPPPAGSE